MSAGAIQYSIGGDASGLQETFAKAMRYAGGFTENLKKALSVRGLFDGIGQGLFNALGGHNVGDLISKALGDITSKEVTQQRFEELLGSPQEASALIGELKKFALGANLSSHELIEQAARMVGPDGTGLMNAGRAVDTLKKIAEVARGSGSSLDGLAEIFTKSFATGEVSARELMQIMNSSPRLYAALRDELGGVAVDMQDLASKGKIGFASLEAALNRVSAGGQIERFRGTARGIADEIKSLFGKIPTAFLGGLISDALGETKPSLIAIREVMEGWVKTAREWGSAIAQVVRTLHGMSWGQIGSTLYDVLVAAFGGAADMLVKALAGVAVGFVASLLAALPAAATYLKDKLFTPGGGKHPDFSDVLKKSGTAFSDAFKTTYDAMPGLGAGDAAAARLKGVLDPNTIFAAAGGPVAGVMAAIQANLRAVFAGNPDAADALRPPNDPNAPRGAGAGRAHDVDRLSRIGLYVGAGGPQGENHAKTTAKHTERTAKAAEKTVALLENPKPVKARF